MDERPAHHGPWRTRVTYEAPAHVPPEGAPLITSQYEPSGSEVVNVAVQSESALLIATNPAVPACHHKVSAGET